MKIDKKLNLVVPVYDENDKVFYVHSTPISREVFENYYKVLARAFNQLYEGGYGIMAGPRMAAVLLRDLAKQSGTWEGVDGVENGLFNEIYRLTNVLIPSPSGWEMIPLGEARNTGRINEEDFREIENAICFFTVNSLMLRRTEKERIVLDSALNMWGAQTSLLNATEFMNSLPTSIKPAPIGEKLAETAPNRVQIPS